MLLAYLLKRHVLISITQSELDINPGGGVLPYSLSGGVPLSSRKSYPYNIPNFALFVTLYQTINAQLFLISIFL